MDADAVVPAAELLAALDDATREALDRTLPPHLPPGALDVPMVRAIDDRVAVRAPLSSDARVVPLGGAALRVHGPRVEEATPGDGMPVILWIHGGGMFLGSAATEDAFCTALVAELGVPVVAVDYRLAPEHPHPAPLDDCAAALTWCAARSDRVVVAGGSAGGGLAAALALRARDEGGPAIAGVHLYYPMLDDRQATPSARRLAEAPVWNRRLADLAWAAYLGGGPADPAAAPSRAERLGGLPPVYLDCGERDMFVDEDVDFALRLRAAGVDVEYHVVPGAVHAFELLAPDAPHSRAATRRRRAALRRHLGLDIPAPDRRRSA